MSDKELQELIHHCNAMEKRLAGGYSKGRRTWTTLRDRAEAELAVRKDQ
jgi:hypothetical protein